MNYTNFIKFNILYKKMNNNIQYPASKLRICPRIKFGNECQFDLEYPNIKI